MPLGLSFTRKSVFCGALIAATAATTYPAAAQYYACPPGSYFAPGYGCVPYAPTYAYSPYDYDYAPYGYAWGGGWGWGGWHHGWGGWHHGGWGGGWGHGGFGHGFAH